MFSPEFVDDPACWGAICHLSLGVSDLQAVQVEKRLLASPRIDPPEPPNPLGSTAKVPRRRSCLQGFLVWSIPVQRCWEPESQGAPLSPHRNAGREERRLCKALQSA